MIGLFDQWRIRAAARQARSRLERLKREGGLPRIALVKQDCNEDLYCCAPETVAFEMLQSTLLRSGPVGLFTTFETDFLILRTEPDPECNIWREKWDPLRWCPVEWFESFRDHVPGRDHGQSRFAQAADQVDWSKYDIVISIDVSVPARITRQFPGVVWAYYVREIKMPSYAASFDAPISGQDLYLTHGFMPRRTRGKRHVVDFPYHFHHAGLFHLLAGRAWPGSERRGVFVDYHSAREATDAELARLEAFGPVYAKRVADDKADAATGERIPERSMSPEGFEALMRCKYHVKWNGRKTFGTAKVEAIAAGCLALVETRNDGSAFLQGKACSFDGFDGLIARLQALEDDRALYQRNLEHQQRLLDYLCYLRPANDLIDAWHATMERKSRR